MHTVMSSLVAYKLRAGLASFAVYVVFAAILAVLVYHYWFPGYLFWCDGGLQGLRLVLLVGFVLGPVLACIIVDPRKSRRALVFDIVVVALLQLGSMAWGLWQVREQRPVAVVYGSHRFISVAPGIMALQRETPQSLQRFSPQQPPLVFRRDPQTAAEKQRVAAMIFRMGFHPEAQAWLYQPFLPNAGRIFAQQAPILAHVRRHLQAEWDAWVRDRPQAAPEAYRLGFFEGRYGNALLVFSPAGALEGYLDLGVRPLPADVVDPPLPAVR